MMHAPITLERKTLLIKLAAISIVLDILTSAIEIPFIFALFGALTIEEFTEMVVSTLVARHDLKLDWIDRTLGFLPIPGVTAVTVAIFREFVYGRKVEAESQVQPFVTKV